MQRNSLLCACVVILAKAEAHPECTRCIKLRGHILFVLNEGRRLPLLVVTPSSKDLPSPSHCCSSLTPHIDWLMLNRGFALINLLIHTQRLPPSPIQRNVLTSATRMISTSLASSTVCRQTRQKHRSLETLTVTVTTH